VTCADIDAFAVASMQMNAAANALSIQATVENLLGQDAGWDTILIADMCYERDLSAAVDAWMKGLARRGALVLIGDPKRNYFPASGLTPLAHYEVQTTRELEDREIRRTGVYRVEP
jgi:predicted nicotinamide N-methyase